MPGIDICCDITRGLPLTDGYVAGIFTEHCIEHITFDAALLVFREFYRVMKPGSYVRIIVPDLEVYVEKYDLFRQIWRTIDAICGRRRDRWHLFSCDERQSDF